MQAPTWFDIHVPSSGSLLCPIELLESRIVYVVIMYCKCWRRPLCTGCRGSLYYAVQLFLPRIYLSFTYRRYVKAAHSLHVSWTFLISVCSTIRTTLCWCLHRHWLKRKLQPVITEGENNVFIALIASALLPSRILFRYHKERKMFNS
jgi:hypothetical protein